MKYIYIQFQCIVCLHSADPNNMTPAVSDNALIGVSVALAVLMASVVGACVPVIVCIYFRSRHSRKETTERYVEYLHIYITFCIYSVGCNALRCSSVMHDHGGTAMDVYANINIAVCVRMWYVLCVHRTEQSTSTQHQS